MHIYNHNKEKTMCMVVSKALPRQSLGEYPNSWITKRMAQKTPTPRAIFLPRGVSTTSWADVRHKSPIRKTVKAIKKVCTYIIWRLIKLMFAVSRGQLKYFGKITCTRAKTTNRTPIILRCNSIFFKYKGGYKRCDLYFLPH